MIIDPKQKMYGLPILKIREIIRLAMEDRFFASKRELIIKVASLTKKSQLISKSIFEQMISEGLLEMEKVKPSGFCLKATDKGSILGVASAGKPISREKATQLLDELIDRAKRVNKNDELVYCVGCIKVFGSYLSDKETIGDLDIGVKLIKRYPENFLKQNNYRISQAKEQGKRFGRLIDQLSYPYFEIMRILKNRCRNISLHDLDSDAIFERTETKTVYEYQVI